MFSDQLERRWVKYGLRKFYQHHSNFQSFKWTKVVSINCFVLNRSFDHNPNRHWCLIGLDPWLRTHPHRNGSDLFDQLQTTWVICRYRTGLSGVQAFVYKKIQCQNPCHRWMFSNSAAKQSYMISVWEIISPEEIVWINIGLFMTNHIFKPRHMNPSTT